MAPKHHETQEQSIKARKHQLFEADTPAAASSSSRPFHEFLRTTPAAPLSGLTRTLLWIAAAVVVLVLIAALLKTFHHPGPTPGRTAQITDDFLTIVRHTG
jgi:hypothetical protein